VRKKCFLKSELILSTYFSALFIFRVNTITYIYAYIARWYIYISRDLYHLLSLLTLNNRYMHPELWNPTVHMEYSTVRSIILYGTGTYKIWRQVKVYKQHPRSFITDDNFEHFKHSKIEKKRSFSLDPILCTTVNYNAGPSKAFIQCNKYVGSLVRNIFYASVVIVHEVNCKCSGQRIATWSQSYDRGLQRQCWKNF
jgi:hypothetical protein